MEDVVAFKKKSKGSRKRARRALEDEEDEEDAAAGSTADGGGHTLQVIADVLEDQRLRKQALRSEVAQAAKRERERPSGTAASSAATTEYGLHDPKKDGSAGKKLLTLLDGQFTGQSATTQRDQHEELLYVPLICHVTGYGEAYGCVCVTCV